MINWLISIIVGGVVPVLTQNFLAVAISSLNPAPAMGDTVQYPVFLSVIVLFTVGFLFISAFSYLVWFVVTLHSHSSVWALIVFLMLPGVIWSTIFAISGV